ncbi:hypothetical protein WJX81_004556 [Elliptochloris bilobata]|uniref:Transcription factor 25 n=1 Tax=Elliptochloris bilobata TaxID=381761 RepID=A0AAW1QCH2_9CHLO
MAARHLQRLRKADVLSAELARDSASDEETSPVTKAAPCNPFKLLSDDEDTRGSDKEATTEQEDSEQAPATSKAPPAKAAGKARRRKKKGKGAAEQSISKQQAAAVGAGGEEDLDKLLAEFHVHEQPTQAAATQPGRASTAAPALLPLLAVDPRRLRADAELERMFGKRALGGNDRDGGQGGGLVGGNRRVRRLVARGVLRRVPLRRGLLVVPRDTWPPVGGGLALEPAGHTADGVPRFRYTHSPAYLAVQTMFQECQETHDPNAIVQLLGQHPYHIDALLALFDLHRATGQHEYAEELLQRCLYALEMAWPPSFRPQARVDFEEEQNRPLFVALFRHIQGLSRRGLHATALEVAKLALGLDPSDPLGLLLYVDFLALRAQQWDFLERLVAEWPGAGLACLPNFAFSLPLGHWLRSRQRHARLGAALARAGGAGAATSGSVGAAREEGEEEEAVAAGDALARAALLHPLAVVQLMERLQDQGVGKDCEWGSVLRRPLFARASDGGSASLAHLTALFVERHHTLWKSAEAQAWLRAACDAASAGSLAGEAETYAAARGEAFSPGAANAYRHLRVHDFSDTVAALPQEELQAMMGGGPREPAGLDEALVALAAAEAVARRRNGGAHTGELDEEALRNMHPLAALLHSLLPWFRVAGAMPGEGELAAAPREGNPGAEDGPGVHPPNVDPVDWEAMQLQGPEALAALDEEQRRGLVADMLATMAAMPHDARRWLLAGWRRQWAGGADAQGAGAAEGAVEGEPLGEHLDAGGELSDERSEGSSAGGSGGGGIAGLPRETAGDDVD